MQALQQLRSVNQDIVLQKPESLAQNIKTFSQDFGFSLILLKKALSIRYSQMDNEILATTVQGIIKDFLYPYRHIAIKVFEDSFDPNTDYLKVRATFNDFIKQGVIKNKANAHIIADFFSPVITSSLMAANRLQATSCFSALDSLIFLLSNEEQLKSLLDPLEFLAYEATIPAKLRDFYKEDLSKFSGVDLKDFLNSSKRFKEFALFRNAPAFNEFYDAYRYRLNIEAMAQNRLGVLDIDLGGDKSLCGLEIVECNILDFVDGACEDELNLGKIDPRVCGNFHRTLYLGWVVDQNIVIPPLSGDQFLKLLDITVDVSKLFSQLELTKCFPSSKNDRLHRCLASALLNDSVSTERSEHKFRKDLQTLLLREFDGNILNFVDHLHERCRHVARYFYFASSEQFLTKLYDLYSTNSDVIEARCDLLRWYAEKYNSPDAHNRAQSLRLDLKLQAVRDDIDDNRIIVDESRFLDWMAENIVSDLRDIQAFLVNDPNFKSSADGDFKKPITVLQNPSLKLADVLDRSFREFCINKNYGVESYMGRRIRHGSIEGYMVADVQEFIRGQKEYHSFDRNFAAYLDGWLMNFRQKIEDLEKEVLHIQSKAQKKGKIVPTIICSEKRGILLNAFSDIETQLRNGDYYAAMSFIYSYCWLFLEQDLRKIRVDLSAIKSGSFLESKEFKEEPKVRCMRRINGICQDKFERVSIWLKKPNNVSPSTSLNLLVSAVVNEIKEQHPNFKPAVVMSGDMSVDLHGHGYHFFYDVLEILVKNAASHGKDDGELSFSFLPSADGIFTLSVKSEVHDTTGLRERIDALFMADIEDAMSQSKNSGIRKLRVLERDTKEIESIFYDIEKNFVIANIELELNRA